MFHNNTFRQTESKITTDMGILFTGQEVLLHPLRNFKTWYYLDNVFCCDFKTWYSLHNVFCCDFKTWYQFLDNVFCCDLHFYLCYIIRSANVRVCTVQHTINSKK